MSAVQGGQAVGSVVLGAPFSAHPEEAEVEQPNRGLAKTGSAPKALKVRNKLPPDRIITQ